MGDDRDRGTWISKLCACTGLIFCDACKVGRYAGALCACVLCLAVYMCILSFSFPDCSLWDGREVSGAGGGEGKEEELSVGELTVSNL